MILTDGEETRGPQPLDERTREQWERSSENWEWILHHPELLEPYRGEYVVIWRQQIVAHGRDPVAVRAQLDSGPYSREPFLAFRVPAREEGDGILVL
ncbi:MAG: hypothetical protein ACRDI2_09875 [Chloroflexota bacterium]